MAKTYHEAGVDERQGDTGLKALIRWVEKTRDFRRGIGAPTLDIGFFANIVDIGGGRGIAFTTDGVGTKVLVAQMLDKYDTIGIDCVAMNVNDLLCVGAIPLTLVDYIAVEEPNAQLMEELGKGLYEGAKQARITITGGEIAQLKEIIRGKRAGKAFDLVGSCIGLVELEKAVTGDAIEDGDVVIGIESSGLHSNGYTLARRALLEREDVDPYEYRADLGTSVAEEMLKPTMIYVNEVVAILEQGLSIKSMAHITSGGFLNLTRTTAAASFDLDDLPETPAIFRLIEEIGEVSSEEMFRVFNMGIGFCIVAGAEDAPKIIEQVSASAHRASRIGSARLDGLRQVRLTRHSILGEEGRFRRLS